MKKLSVLVAIVLAALMIFAACSTPAAQESSSAPASTAAPASESASASTAAESPSAAPSEMTAVEKQQASDDAIAKMKADAEAGIGSTNNDVVIGYNAGTESLEFFQDVYGGLKAAAEHYGVQLLYTDSEFDTTKIMSNVDSLMMQGANVIIDFNVNSEVGGNIVDEVASKGGFGVIGIDVEYTSATTGQKSWFMGANNEIAGELCGEAIADYAAANKDGKVDKLVLFWNSENGDEVKKRMGGAIIGLANKGINLTDDQVVWLDMGGGGSDTTVAAKDKFTNWLTANPDVHSIGIVAVNDESMQGVLAAAETAGRADDCIMAGHNVGANFTQEVLNNGPACWVGDVAYYPEKYGDYLVPMCIAIAHGTASDPSLNITMNHVMVLRDMVPDYMEYLENVRASWE